MCCSVITALSRWLRLLPTPHSTLRFFQIGGAYRLSRQTRTRRGRDKARVSSPGLRQHEHAAWDRGFQAPIGCTIDKMLAIPALFDCDGKQI